MPKDKVFTMKLNAPALGQLAKMHQQFFGRALSHIAETSSQLKIKTNNASKSTKVPSSSRNEEIKKSREPSTDRSNVKKSLTSQKSTKKVESSRLKTETPKTRTVSNNGTSRMSVNKTVSKSSDKLNVSNVTPRTSLSKTTIKPVKSLATTNTTTNLNSSRTTSNVPLKGTKSSSKDVPSKRVTKEQYFPKKYPYSSYLHENDELKSDRSKTVSKTINEVKSDRSKTIKKVVKKVEEEKMRPKLSRERTMTRILSPGEVKVIKNIVDDGKINSTTENSKERPRTATIRKHYDVSETESIVTHPESINFDSISKEIEDTVPQNDDKSSENDYEDDFDSYESDFEAYSSSGSTASYDIDTNSMSSESTTSSSSSEEKLTELTQKRTNSAGTEEERKLDSGNYDLPDIKHKQILDKIKEAVEKENSNLNKLGIRETISNLASLSDEGFEEGSKHSLVNTGFINFMDAKKKQQQKKIISKSRKRGDDLMGMIRLNNIYFSLFDMKAISYDDFMQSYGKSGTIQMSSQTGHDDVDEEVQTDKIVTLNQSTQFPIRFSQFDENPEPINSTDKTWDYNKTQTKLKNFMERTGKLVLHILEQKERKTEQITKKNERELPFSDGYFGLNFENIPFMNDRTISQISYSKQSKLLTVHESNIQVHMDQNMQLLSRSTICIWDITEPAYPLHILVSSGEITKACFDNNHGFLIFAGICDGSVSLWDLRENSKLHRSIYDESTDKYHILRSPTYTTTTNVDGDVNSSKIIAIHSFCETITANQGFQRNTSGIQVATLDETGLIVLWSVIQKSATPELLSEDQGLIPWGCVLLVQGLTINLQKLNPNLKELQCFDLQFSESDFNHLYIVSNYGVLHCLTSGMKPKPKIYSTDKSTVNCVEMAPFSSTHFLSGCENGNIKLHSRFYEKPLMTLCSTEEQKKFEENIQLIEWSDKRPCVFFVKDITNSIHIWDLTASDMYPIYSIPFKEDISDIKFLPSIENCYLAIASKSYGVRIHTVSKEFAKITPDQYKTELNIFLNYANRL